eukprot:307924-Chlamydomonas_euryale.AAC.5
MPSSREGGAGGLATQSVSQFQGLQCRSTGTPCSASWRSGPALGCSPSSDRGPIATYAAAMHPSVPPETTPEDRAMVEL